ncbi:TIGR00730 family Rossman fold protein [Vacuolonema iberomarrocanum]|uniref:LOG family protein n=1 Tax=Vacuolonema iberomarrocanum TaxID=3454632 RepID=UPI001A071B35|nr:TIGR00730 family Rossman fold protein [filamentous cyanobacterium LEGE 07170]
MRYVCVFCGSNGTANAVIQQAAIATGKELAQRGLGLVYGGGKAGLMGILADTVLQAGGEAIGVIPEFLIAKEIAHEGLSTLHTVSSMHERKTQMSSLADGFLTLPGSYGTLEEFCEVLTWKQLGLHQKPCGLLNVAQYYDPLLAMLDKAVDVGLMRPRMRSLVLTAAEPGELLEAMERDRPPLVNQWLKKDTQL